MVLTWTLIICTWFGGNTRGYEFHSVPGFIDEGACRDAAKTAEKITADGWSKTRTGCVSLDGLPPAPLPPKEL